MSESGNYQGRHYSTYVEDVRALKRAGRLDEAEQLLLHLIDAVEAEAREKQWGVAGWYYGHLAIVRRKQRNRAGEVAILQRYARQHHGRVVGPLKLLERLRKLTGEVHEPHSAPLPDVSSSPPTSSTTTFDAGGIQVTATFVDGDDRSSRRDYGQEVVGESHYQDTLRHVRETEGDEFTALLEAEPDNPYDPNAVRVAGPDGDTLGYLPRAVARRQHDLIAAAGGIEVDAKLFGGAGSKGSIGVWLEWQPEDTAPKPPRRSTASDAAPGNSRDNLTLGQGCGCLVAVLATFGILASFCG